MFKTFISVSFIKSNKVVGYDMALVGNSSEPELKFLPPQTLCSSEKRKMRADSQ